MNQRASCMALLSGTQARNKLAVDLHKFHGDEEEVFVWLRVYPSKSNVIVRRNGIPTQKISLP